MSQNVQINVEELAIQAAESISLENLDEALLSHTILFEQVTRQLPELRWKTAESKMKLEQIKSALSKQLRAEAAEIGKKVTEGSLEADILTNRTFLDAQKLYLDDRYAQDLVERARDVLVQREGAIKGLITLYQAQYWTMSGIERANNIPQATTPEGEKTFKRRG